MMFDIDLYVMDVGIIFKSQAASNQILDPPPLSILTRRNALVSCQTSVLFVLESSYGISFEHL